MSHDDTPDPDPIAESLRLRRSLARTAGQIAETEDQVARTRREIAEQRPEHAERYLAAARHAEEFAASERAEQRRLDQPEVAQS